MGLGSGIRDPGSAKNPFRIPDPGVKKAPDPVSGSATLILDKIVRILIFLKDPYPQIRNSELRIRIQEPN
jgi:hypothetical protein